MLIQIVDMKFLIYQQGGSGLLSNTLETRFTALGYNYTRTASGSYPANANDYPMMFLDHNVFLFNATVVSNLNSYVQSGGTLVVMGERVALYNQYNAPLETLLNNIIIGGGIAAFQGTSADDNNQTTINTSVIGNLDANPNTITTFNFIQGNQWSGISGNNVWATGDQGLAAAAVWEGSNVVGGTGKVIMVADQSWALSATAEPILQNMYQYSSDGYSPAGGCLPGTDNDNDGYFTDGTGLGNDPDDTDPCNPDNTVSACDTDSDGVPDGNDTCPSYAGTEANGCDATETSCTDTIDNDGDGDTDCADSDCATSSTACGTDGDNDGYYTNGAGAGNDPDDTDPCNPDNTVSVCDTDSDGVPDGNDTCPTYAGTEANGCDATETSCTDTIDNDGDGNTDCADSDCSADAACSTPISGLILSADCSTNTADISGITSANLPAGTSLTWHTGTPATDLNKLSSLTTSTPGTYYAAFYDAVNMCYSTAETTVVITAAQCIQNTCPTTTVNLNTGYSVSNLPAGTTLTWHTAVPVTNANKIADVTAVSSGNYYAAFFDAANMCYSDDGNAATEVIVEIINCGNDNDSDGVIDITDLDDDNDGILDTDECPIVLADFAGIASPNEINAGDPSFTTSMGIDGSTLSTDLTITAPVAIGGAAGFELSSNDVGGDFQILRFQDNSPSNAGDGFSTTMNFSTPNGVKILASNAFGASNIDDRDQFTFTPIGAPANFEWVLLSSANAIITQSGNSITITGTGPNSTFVDFDLVCNVPISGLAVVYEHTISLGVNSGRFSFSFCPDTDSDGILDQFDTDADGDGCFDAVEAGHGQTVDANGYIATTSGEVGANGLDNDIESDDTQATTANYTVTQTNAGTNDFQDAFTKHPNCPCIQDSDNDTVCNEADLDDDNDGILDTDETICAGYTLDASSITAVSPDVSNVVITGSHIYNGTINPSSTYTDTGVPNGLANGALRFGVGQTPAADQYLEYTLDFPEPVMLNLSQAEVNGWFDNQEKWTITSVGGSMLVTSPDITHGLINNGAGGTGPELQFITGNNTNQISFTPTANGGHIPTANSQWSVVSNDFVSSITIRYEMSSLNISGAGNQRGPIGLYVSCIAPDTDNDGTPDYLDLDSDGDGCFDATEGGHGQTVDANGLIATTFVEVGANGLDNDVESDDTQAAMANYTITQTNVGDK